MSSGRLLAMIFACSLSHGANAQLDSNQLSAKLGAALEKMQAVTIMTYWMEKECATAFPHTASQIHADIANHLKTEIKIYRKLDDTWQKLTAERPKDVQAYNWIQERRIAALLHNLKSAPASERRLETECYAYFYDMRSGGYRRALPDLYSLLDRFARDEISVPPTFPMLDDISERLIKPNER